MLLRDRPHRDSSDCIQALEEENRRLRMLLGLLEEHTVERPAPQERSEAEKRRTFET
jgi:hypothetical protein